MSGGQDDARSHHRGRAVIDLARVVRIVEEQLADDAVRISRGRCRRKHPGGREIGAVFACGFRLRPGEPVRRRLRDRRCDPVRRWLVVQCRWRTLATDRRHPNTRARQRPRPIEIDRGGQLERLGSLDALRCPEAIGQRRAAGRIGIRDARSGPCLGGDRRGGNAHGQERRLWSDVECWA